MNRNIFLMVVLLQVILVGCLNDNNFFKKLEDQTGITLNEKKWCKTFVKEDWGINGDGFYIASFRTDDELQIRGVLNQKGFRKLPLEKSLPASYLSKYSKIPMEGYYWIEYPDNDIRNFDLILIDAPSKKIIYYYQIL